MQRFIAPTIMVMLAACAQRAAPAPAVPEAPELAVASPLERAATVQLSDDTTSARAETEAVEPAKAEPGAEATAEFELTGDYRYASGRSSIARAIEGVVAPMNALIRSTARKRLKDANGAPKTISITEAGDEVTVRIDGRTYTATLDGASRRVKGADGKPAKLRYRMHDGALWQSFETAQGTRTNVFQPRERGGITMTVVIRSKQLPRDLRYQLGYTEGE